MVSIASTTRQWPRITSDDLGSENLPIKSSVSVTIKNLRLNTQIDPLGVEETIEVVKDSKLNHISFNPMVKINLNSSF